MKQYFRSFLDISVAIKFENISTERITNFHSCLQYLSLNAFRRHFLPTMAAPLTALLATTFATGGEIASQKQNMSIHFFKDELRCLHVSPPALREAMYLVHLWKTKRPFIACLLQKGTKYNLFFLS